MTHGNTKKAVPQAVCRTNKTLASPGRHKAAAIGAIALFIIGTLAIFWFVGRPMIAFISQPETFRLWVSSHGILSRLAFLGMVMLQVVVAIIPGEPLEIAAGYAFGLWEGTLLCLVGLAVGSALVFILVRTLGIRIVEVFFPREKIQSLQFLQNEKRLNFTVALLFFIPGTPKDIIAYVVGLTSMRLSVWLLISFFARIPSVVTSTIAGNELGNKNYWAAAIVFGATLLLSGIGLLVYRRICAKRVQK